MSENELEKQLKQRDQCSTGTRRKRVNVSKSYNSRF
jgi:hypothetical protein